MLCMPRNGCSVINRKTRGSHYTSRCAQMCRNRKHDNSILFGIDQSLESRKRLLEPYDRKHNCIPNVSTTCNRARSIP